MIAVDTNLLVYAHRKDSGPHEAALRALRGLAEGRGRWGLPWPCVHEFLAIVTHPRIFHPPTPLEVALASIEVWLSVPNCAALGECPGYFTWLEETARGGKVSGPGIQDARVAAICRQNGVTELWSADRDFSRFQGLVVKNPLG